YQVIFWPVSILHSVGFSPEVKQGHLSIGKVAAKGPSGEPTPAFLAGLRTGDQILSIYNARGEGKAIHGLFDLGEVSRTVHRGEPFDLEIRRGGDAQTFQIRRLTMHPASRSEPIRLLVAGLLVVLPLLAIITACLIGFLKPQDNNAFTASLLFLSFSSIFGNSYYMFPAGLREPALLV